MVFDVEADGLLDVATKIHVLAYKGFKDKEVRYTHDYDEMREILTSAKILCGHNIICYDIPLVEKLLGIKITARPIDTLALSWYLNHSRVIHGLDSYGEEAGIPKPKISDWEGLTPAEYAHRCVEDVKINSWLWGKLKTKLLQLYNTKDEADKLINYLSFKMDCLREQEANPWRLDVPKTEKHLQTLIEQEEEKLPELKIHMPLVDKWEFKTKPAKPFKKDGSVSAHGEKWFALLAEHNLLKDYDGEVKVLKAQEEPNPNSHQQVKDWLFSLGWKPTAFDYKKNDDGTERKIPQVRVDGEEGKELCPSVLELAVNHPEIKVLEGLTIIQHRMSVFKGFLENHKDGFLIAGAGGFTNTLRLKHRVLVNLPGVDKPWGEEIRGCLIAPDGYELCGSDMSSLEDNTKRHYMYPYDPEYVKEMSVAGFDPHLDLAKHAGAITEKQYNDYAIDKAVQAVLKPIRKNFKAANYSCIYGVGAPKLARTISIPVKEAQKLIDAYWARNWSVKKLAEDTEIKHVGKEMWLFNPVSRFWYSLRYKKDIFSTLNQGTGVYCFDRWIMSFREKRPQLTAQFHDEVVLCIMKGFRDKCRSLLKSAIEAVNNELKLNVKLDVDVQFGKSYAEIH